MWLARLQTKFTQGSSSDVAIYHAHVSTTAPLCSKHHLMPGGLMKAACLDAAAGGEAMRGDRGVHAAE